MLNKELQNLKNKYKVADNTLSQLLRDCKHLLRESDINDHKEIRNKFNKKSNDIVTNFIS